MAYKRTPHRTAYWATDSNSSLMWSRAVGTRGQSPPPPQDFGRSVNFVPIKFMPTIYLIDPRTFKPSTGSVEVGHFARTNDKCNKFENSCYEHFAPKTFCYILKLHFYVVLVAHTANNLDNVTVTYIWESHSENSHWIFQF